MSTQLPPLFRPLLWSYDFSRIDADKQRRTIIVQALNYGTLEHWRWIKNHYGVAAIREVLSGIPASEIRPKARRLASLLSLAGTWNYAPRRAH